MAEEELELRYTIYVKTYGTKAKCVRDIGHVLCKMLYSQFPGRFRIADHRSQPIEYDPDAHDFGVGEA